MIMAYMLCMASMASMVAVPLTAAGMGRVDPQPAQEHELVTIQDTGPSENRIDFVIVGDGFLASELDEQEKQLRRAAENVLRYEPYAEYVPYFNIHLIKTVSKVQGAGVGSGMGT